MESAFKQVIRDTLVSYEEVGGLNNTDGHNLPSKRMLGQICSQLLQILFPGFHDENPIHKCELGDLTEERLKKLANGLEDQISKSLQVADPTCPKAKAQDVLMRLLQSLPEVRNLLRTDIEAAYEGDPAALSNEEIILSYPCIEAIAIQRVAHILYIDCVPLLPRMMTEWAHAQTGIDIHPGARIGAYFFIDHGTGVVIGETSVIGKHVRLYQAVTLGAKRFTVGEGGVLEKGQARHPILEDDVVVYAGATILGCITIGQGSSIGGNVWLTHSVPPNSHITQASSRHEPPATKSQQP